MLIDALGVFLQTWLPSSHVLLLSLQVHNCLCLNLVSKPGWHCLQHDCCVDQGRRKLGLNYSPSFPVHIRNVVIIGQLEDSWYATRGITHLRRWIQGFLIPLSKIWMKSENCCAVWMMDVATSRYWDSKKTKGFTRIFLCNEQWSPY